MRNFRSWEIYKNGLSLVTQIYKTTKDLPKEEAYGLTSQVRRAAVSIVCNIAEGSAKTSSKDFKRFLEMSLGSAFEVETLLIVMQNLNYCSPEELNELIVKIEVQQKRINAFIQKIKREDLN